MIKVSVIVPVYNVEAYLPKCLDTLVKQTLQDMEIIVVNDGTKDNSQAVIDSFVSKYPNVTGLTKENGGLSDARNYGMQFAKGEYIGFVDSDDYVEYDMYKILYHKAKEKDYDIVECNLHHVYENGSIDTEIAEQLTDPKEMLMLGRSVVWNKIYRRKWLEDSGVVFPKGYIYEDVEFFSKLVPHIRSYAYVEEACIYYVQRGNSINNKQTMKTLQIIDVLEHISRYYQDIQVYEEYREALEFLYARILLCSSFSRICRIPDRKQRRKALKSNWRALNEHFPDWHDNQYLQKQNTRNGKFMKSMNRFSYSVCSELLPFYFKWRK